MKKNNDIQEWLRLYDTSAIPENKINEPQLVAAKEYLAASSSVANTLVRSESNTSTTLEGEYDVILDEMFPPPNKAIPLSEVPASKNLATLNLGTPDESLVKVESYTSTVL